MRKLFLFAAAALSVVAVQAQSLVGSWKGKLNAGAVDLNIVFHVDNAGKVTMDSPDQGALGIEAVIKFLSADSVNVEFPDLRAQYSGRLLANEIQGTFTQMGYSFPLNLERGDVKLSRPQTPQPPFLYKTEEVSFTNDGTDPATGKTTEAGGATLSGTLVYPENFKNGMPVVLMVTGSGQQNRDEELMGHKPFLVIADYLAKHGIATLRYDDRGVGRSTGAFDKATTYDNMLDAKAGVEYLRKTRQFGKIGILGHSEGGSVAYMLAARGVADFVVSLAGPVLPGDSILLGQNREILSAAGLDNDNVGKYLECLSKVVGYLQTSQKSRFSSPETVVAMLTAGSAIPEPLKANLVEAYKMLDNPWMKYYITYNPREDFAGMKCPVMILFGEKDTQVSATLNIRTANALLPSKLRDKSVINAYPGLNHLFQPSKTGSPMEYGKIETTISGTVLKDISDWIEKYFGK